MVLNYTNQPLIYTIRSIGATSGTINISLLIVNPNNVSDVKVNISKAIPYNADSYQFCSMVREIQYYFQYYDQYAKCEVTYLDKDLNVLPMNASQDSIFGYEWTIKYQKPLINYATK